MKTMTILTTLLMFAFSSAAFSDTCESDTLFKEENVRLKNIGPEDLEKLIPLSIWDKTIYLPNRFMVRMRKGREGVSLVTHSTGLESYFNCDFKGGQFLYGSIDAGKVEDCMLCRDEKGGFKMKIDKLTLGDGFHVWTHYIPNSRPIVVVFDDNKYLKIVDRNDFLSKSIVQQLGLNH
ncbi:hypothetical protein [Teredinibacter purpureus]|uniref:hypothetical protein n=1 Tax=Teredinibacter purpureus TaxID=2731756 RepID=UPI0013C5022A|nr:hypothetical protein [Teredinibacter purpureus]